MKTLYSFSSKSKISPMKGSLLVLWPFLLAGLISCGTNPSTTVQAGSNVHPTTVLSKQVDPCSLVTQTQIEQILKTPLTVSQRPPGTNKNSVQNFPCGYFSSDFAVYVGIGLQTYQDTGAARTAFTYHSHHFAGVFTYTANGQPPPGKIHVTHQTIMGLGNQAIMISFPSFQMLLVQKDNGILSVSVSVTGQPVSLVENEDKQLAQLAVRHM